MDFGPVILRSFVVAHATKDLSVRRLGSMALALVVILGACGGGGGESPTTPTTPPPTADPDPLRNAAAFGVEDAFLGR